MHILKLNACMVIELRLEAAYRWCPRSMSRLQWSAHEIPDIVSQMGTCVLLMAARLPRQRRCPPAASCRPRRRGRRRLCAQRRESAAAASCAALQSQPFAHDGCCQVRRVVGGAAAHLARVNLGQTVRCGSMGWWRHSAGSCPHQAPTCWPATAPAAAAST